MDRRGFLGVALLVMMLTGCVGQDETAGGRLLRPVPGQEVVRSKGMQKADEAYLARRYDEAYKLYRAEVLADPRNYNAHDGLTRAAAVLDKQEELAKFYEQRLKAARKNPGYAYGASRVLLALGRRVPAAHYCGLALRREPRLARAHFLLGLMYFTQNVPDYKRAAAKFEDALEIDPNYGPTCYQFALLEAGRGNRTRARQLAARALSCFIPVEADVKFRTHVLLGALWSGERNYPAALKQYKKAREIAGNRVYEKVDIGRVYELMGRREDAIREWRDVQGRFGLASRAGLSAFRNIRRLESKGVVDYGNFLPGADARKYGVLVTYLASNKLTPASRVPENIRKLLSGYKTPIRTIQEDLDGNGTREIIVVETREKLDDVAGRYLLSNPTLHVFTERGGAIGYYKSTFDHFHDVKAVDLDGDARKEIVFTAFVSPNIFNLIVLSKREPNKRYLNVFVQTVRCVTAACGVLIDDLNGDGRPEVMSVSGADQWVTVNRVGKDGAFEDVSARFPQFYRDYVKTYGRMKPKDLEQFPLVKEHLREAQRLAPSIPMHRDEPKKDGTE